MSGAYMGDGRRRSSMTHATRGHECSLCGRMVFGNGGQVSHGRGHVRRGEAVELFKEYGWYDGHPLSSRLFLAPDDVNVERFEAKGFARVTA